MFKKILEENKYLSIKDLKYNNKYNYKFNNDKIKEFISYKEENSIKLNLLSFNSNYIYYINHDTLNTKLREFINFNRNYQKRNNMSLIENKLPDIMISRILSEIEGTLLIENIPTTRKRIQEVINSKVIKSKDDIIIRNMDNAIKFLLDKPSFNKENLFNLYNILSSDSLSEENKINSYYRYDKVYIDSYEGCEVNKIEECMNSLFDFINNNLNQKSNFIYLLPHIAHYYILYIHPYFDFNGRCARLVSLWISLLTNLTDQPLYISEAINDNKNDYYTALSNTRDNKNDLTFFLNYIFNISNSFSLLYENIEHIEKILFDNSITLSVLEKTYIKRLISKNNTKYFNYKMFIEIINLDITKQGALKILNKLENYKILKSIINNKNQKMFYLNKDYIKYEIKGYD